MATEIPAKPADQAAINRLWADNYDGRTTGIIEGLPIQPTWRCLDAGAGSGSMSYWLADRVPQGSVIAIDTDVSLLDPGYAPNLIVEQADVSVKEPDGSAGLDLILIRAVLSLVPDPGKLIARAVSWLAPGGWLLAEDFYFMPAADSPTAIGRKVGEIYIRAFESSGAKPQVGRQLASALARVGLTGVRTSIRPLGPGESETQNALMRARMELQGPALVDSGALAKEDIDQFVAALYRPECQDVTTLLFSVWGQR